VPVAAGVLKRVKPTAEQVGLSRMERAANVQGSFQVTRKARRRLEAAASFWSRRAHLRRRRRWLCAGVAARRHR
jgi:hypothetical protein